VYRVLYFEEKAHDRDSMKSGLEHGLDSGLNI